PVWNIENSFEEIASYNCQKATTNYKGRIWTAWFCPDIPVGEGPWKLRGLPGLILKAEDSKGHFRFTCAGFKQLVQKRIIEKDQTHDYQIISRGDLDMQYKKFFSDPNDFLNNAIDLKGGSVKLSGPVLKREYNPIELDK
ncbi:MAG: GLPGLI family protein, partial [Prevotellaceae bacterium]|nr:GLPGLI family protein [Prevotellaceae bacterium]